MATTRLMALHIGKGRSIAGALADSTEYIENPNKTRDGELVTGYECEPRTADAEFLLSKREYFMRTGRDQGERNVIAYHLRQSFKPGEVSAEEGNKIGRELALRFTKGKHAFIVATHVDRAHVHNHIIFNSTQLDGTRKFWDFLGSAFALRRVSDRVCLEHRLSVVENPQPSRGSYGDWLGDAKPVSQREKLRRAIDEALEKKPGDLEVFLAEMKALGFEAKRGKYLAFKAPGAERFIRCKSLGEDYTEEAVRERIAGRRADPVRRGDRSQTVPRARASSRDVVRKESSGPSLLIDIEARLRAGKGPGYERWAKVFNLKQAAQTLIYLQERGFASYEELAEKTAQVSSRYDALAKRMKELEKTLRDNGELQRQIVNYSKTRAAYIAYRKAGYSRKFREAHETDILVHQAAKKHFDALGLMKLPTIASLRAAYAESLEEKRQVYREYQQLRAERKELLVAKANADRLLDLPEPTPDGTRVPERNPAECASNRSRNPREV